LTSHSDIYISNGYCGWLTRTVLIPGSDLLIPGTSSVQIFTTFEPRNLIPYSMRWNFDEPSPREGTNCIKYDLRKETFGKTDIIPMWVADMDFNTPDFIINALSSRLKHEILGYSFRPPEYFSSIIGWSERRHGWKIEKEWICFSPGIVPALNFCTLAYTHPGDTILVQPPVYFPFFSAVESHGRKLVYNKIRETGGTWEMDYENLRDSIDEKTRMIFISNPHNPLGRVWSADELSELAVICLENNILIVSDEIHCDLVMPGFKHTPVAKLSDKASEITITCLAPSKTFNLAGLSTSSVIISNPELRKSFNSVVEKLHVGSGNIFGSAASIAAYSYGSEWLDELLSYLSKNVSYVVDYCREHIPEIIPVRTEATYMIWLDCRSLGMTGRELQNFFITKAGVGMNEGSTFGPGGEGYMRMNLACPLKMVTRAMHQIDESINGIR
jgi:cysteine-S-conjugate beta-lyase